MRHTRMHSVPLTLFWLHMSMSCTYLFIWFYLHCPHHYIHQATSPTYPFLAPDIYVLYLFIYLVLFTLPPPLHIQSPTTHPLLLNDISTISCTDLFRSVLLHPCSACAQIAYGGDWGLFPCRYLSIWTTGMTDLGSER